MTSVIGATSDVSCDVPSIKVGEVTLHFEMQEPNEEIREKARNELRETAETKAQAVAELRKLLDDMPELYCPKENIDWLIRFLRPCKFYPESARDLIVRYFTFKKKHVDIYEGLLPSREENIFKHNITTVIRGRDQFGRRILLLELGKNWQYKEVTLDEVFKAVVLFLEIAIGEPITQICGAVVIFDMDGLSLKQTWQFTPHFAKLIVDWLQDAIPVRVKAIHVVNQPKIFKVVFAIFQQFLREKLRSRIFFHGNDRESLHKFISHECLPPCYGGFDETQRVAGLSWYQLLLKYEENYKVINTYGFKNVN